MDTCTPDVVVDHGRRPRQVQCPHGGKTNDADRCTRGARADGPRPSADMGNARDPHRCRSAGGTRPTGSRRAGTQEESRHTTKDVTTDTKVVTTDT
jgi:hypothetical protein